MSRLYKNKEYFTNAKQTVDKAKVEINKGLTLLNTIKEPIIAFFGSHQINSSHNYYKHCYRAARELAKKGHAILSGGGPGIMHAANSGATDVGVSSIGLWASLLTEEEITDPIYTEKMEFHFLFARRFLMAIKSEALIFYPGGYGTLNELFEYLVLMQTGIVDTVPVICVNREYWKDLFHWLKDHPLNEEMLIHGVQDINLIHFVDSVEEILEKVK